MSPPLPPAAAVLCVHGPRQAGRAEVEAFIRGVYADRYGAVVPGFAPTLVSLRDGEGAIIAAAGYREAGAGPLFLERYLAAPVESVLGALVTPAPHRSAVVEIGHLAAGHRAGAGYHLMALLGPHLGELGFGWAVSTLTQGLHRLMLRTGIRPMVLAPADPRSLGREAAAWGTYYEHHPVVVAGEVAPALRCLAPAPQFVDRAAA
jgi:hypothetical protein